MCSALVAVMLLVPDAADQNWTKSSAVGVHRSSVYTAAAPRATATTSVIAWVNASASRLHWMLIIRPTAGTSKAQARNRTRESQVKVVGGDGASSKPVYVSAWLRPHRNTVPKGHASARSHGALVPHGG